jgi:hypothetical protein
MIYPTGASTTTAGHPADTQSPEATAMTNSLRRRRLAQTMDAAGRCGHGRARVRRRHSQARRHRRMKAADHINTTRLGNVTRCQYAVLLLRPASRTRDGKAGTQQVLACAHRLPKAPAYPGMGP